jgi:GTP-binding protein YchF
MDLGIIGLAQSGKTALFAALTRGHAHTAGFAATEPSIGVVKIRDDRLDRLSAVLHPRKVTYAEARYLDFPGALTVRGEGPAAVLLGALSQCDALVHVVRAFHDESVPHPEGNVDPDHDFAAVNMELAFADIGVLQRRYEKLEIMVRSARAGEREAGERELALVQRLRDGLEREEPLRAQALSADDRRMIGGFQLLSSKPQLVVVNIDEGDVARAGEMEGDFSARHGGPGVAVLALCAKLERELAELSDEEAAEFRKDLGLSESGAGRVLRASGDVLGLLTFFTVGDQEGRAWVLPAGSSALEAGGKVHTDIARGFIRAEVIGWDEMVACGSWAEARKRGLLRTEGKQYVVQDGDLLHVLFNV